MVSLFAKSLKILDAVLKSKQVKQPYSKAYLSIDKKKEKWMGREVENKQIQVVVLT